MPRLWRLYQPDLPDTPGAEVEVGPEESRHARKVLRLRAGEAVAVFDNFDPAETPKGLAGLGASSTVVEDLRLEDIFVEVVGS